MENIGFSTPGVETCGFRLNFDSNVEYVPRMSPIGMSIQNSKSRDKSSELLESCNVNTKKVLGDKKS